MVVSPAVPLHDVNELALTAPIEMTGMLGSDTLTDPTDEVEVVRPGAVPMATFAHRDFTPTGPLTVSTHGGDFVNGTAERTAPVSGVGLIARCRDGSTTEASSA